MREWLASLRNRQTNKPGAIQAGATNLTMFSGVVAAIAAGATVFNNSVTKIFGEQVSDEVKAAVLIAIIAAWAAIVVADLMARARAAVPAKQMQSLVDCLTTDKGKEVLDRLGRLAGDDAGWHVAPAAAGLGATVVEGRDEPGFLVAAMRYRRTGDSLEYLLLKPGTMPRWYPSTAVEVVAAGDGPPTPAPSSPADVAASGAGARWRRLERWR